MTPPPVLEGLGLIEACRWVEFSPEVAEALEAACQRVENNPSERAALIRLRGHWLQESDIKVEADHDPLFYALLYISALPDLLKKLEPSGIPKAIIQATLRDLEVWIKDFHGRRGQWGIDQYHWPSVYFSGRLFALGRLQFEMTTFPTNCELPPGLTTASPILNVHIPATGSLSADACEKAFAEAREFFPKYFPERKFDVFFCESWLMDRQLGEYQPDSNVVKFQQRFLPLKLNESSDNQMWERVFGGRVDLAQAPRDTQLRRVMLDHIAKGGHWATSAGYIPFH